MFIIHLVFKSLQLIDALYLFRKALFLKLVRIMLERVFIGNGIKAL